MKRKRVDDDSVSEKKNKASAKDGLTWQLGNDCIRHMMRFLTRHELHAGLARTSKTLQRHVREVDLRRQTLTLVTAQNPTEAAHRNNWDNDIPVQLAQVPNLTHLTLYEAPAGCVEFCRPKEDHDQDRMLEPHEERQGRVFTADQWRSAFLSSHHLPKLRVLELHLLNNDQDEVHQRCNVLSQAFFARWPSLTNLSFPDSETKGLGKVNHQTFSLAIGACISRLVRLNVYALPVPVNELGWMLRDCGQLVSLDLQVSLDLWSQLDRFTTEMTRILNPAVNPKLSELRLKIAYQWDDGNGNHGDELFSAHDCLMKHLQLRWSASTGLGLLAESNVPIYQRLWGLDKVCILYTDNVLLGLDKLERRLSYSVYDLEKSLPVLSRLVFFAPADLNRIEIRAMVTGQQIVAGEAVTIVERLRKHVEESCRGRDVKVVNVSAGV